MYTVQKTTVTVRRSPTPTKKFSNVLWCRLLGGSINISVVFFLKAFATVAVIKKFYVCKHENGELMTYGSQSLTECVHVLDVIVCILQSINLCPNNSWNERSFVATSEHLTICFCRHRLLTQRAVSEGHLF